MNKQRVVFADFQGYLTDCLDKRLTFNITDGPADFCNDDIRIRLFSDGINKGFDFICNMGNDLNGLAQVFTPSFLGKDIPVHFAGGEVGEAVQIFINEPFIVAKIQIRFRTVFRYINLPMLIGAHRSRINIYVRIKLLRRNPEAARLQKSAERRRRDALS